MPRHVRETGVTMFARWHSGLPDKSVLMVTREHASDRRYGLGRSLSTVVNELRGRGISVQYLCQADLPDSHIEHRDKAFHLLSVLPGVKGYPIRVNILYAWIERLVMGWYAAEVTRRERLQRVHLHDPWLAVGFWLGAKLLCRHHLRWGLTEHGYGSYSRATHEDGLTQGPRARRVLRRIEALVLDAADWVIVPTRLALNRLAEDLEMASVPSHWRVLPHACRRITRWEKAAARAALGWEPHALYVLAVGRIVPLKRFERLLEACLRLAPGFPGLRLCLLGEGGEDLRQMADGSGRGEILQIVTTDDVSPYLAATDVYVSTSSTESFGLSNLEAICAGVPSICTAVGGVPEVVGNGAYLIRDDLSDLSEVLNLFLSSSKVRSRWTDLALEHAEAWPSIREVGDGYVEIYRFE